MKKLILLLFIPLISFSQEVLNNESIMDMIELGFEEQVIIDKIESTNSDFDTSIETLKTLKESGATPVILSAMIKAGKKEVSEITEPIKKASPPKSDDTFFYWENGKGELVKVSFYNTLVSQYEIDEYEIAGWTKIIMMEATIGLKSKLSFIPNNFLIRERFKTDKILTQNDKTTHIAQLGYTATNSYGGMVEGVKIIGINPTLKPAINTDSTKEDYVHNSETKKYKFEKGYAMGTSVKLKGKVYIDEETLTFITDASKYMARTEYKIPIVSKVFISENHWKVEYDYNGIPTICEYLSDSKRYKTDGGILILKGGGYESIYPLTIVE